MAKKHDPAVMRVHGSRNLYMAENAWLGLFQMSLEVEFNIDPLTLLASTKCMY
jgi:hypothetical protein